MTTAEKLARLSALELENAELAAYQRFASAQTSADVLAIAVPIVSLHPNARIRHPLDVEFWTLRTAAR